MTRSAVAAEKIAAYHATGYRIDATGGAILLRIGERSDDVGQLLAAHGFVCGAFLTAWNPLGTIRSAQQNEDAQGRLVADVRSMGAELVVIEGASVDPSHQWPDEEGVFVMGIDLNDVKALGVKYEQDGIVWVGGDFVPELVLLR